MRPRQTPVHALLWGSLWGALAFAVSCGDPGSDGDSDTGSADTNGVAGASSSAGDDASTAMPPGTTSGADSTGPSPSSSGVGSSSDGDASTSSDSGSRATMSFFVTSEGNGAAGGNYGGLVGADARCASLASAAGSTRADWRAYLSQAAIDGARSIDARDRIGSGPWINAAGQTVATDLGALHRAGIDPALMLDELGEPAGKAEPPGPEHDILTGSNPDGTLAGPGLTCANWTSNSSDDRARVGHHDWSAIPNPITPTQNFNSVHDSDCDAPGLAAVLGSGRLYCFASD